MSKGHSFDYSNKGHRGHTICSALGCSDPSFFSFRKRGEERVISLSGAIYMSGRKKPDQEIHIPPEVEQLVDSVEMQYNYPTSEDKHELGVQRWSLNRTCSQINVNLLKIRL
jgi:hypothetical protein